MTLSRAEQSRRHIVKIARQVAKEQPGLQYDREIAEAVEEALGWGITEPENRHEEVQAIRAYREAQLKEDPYEDEGERQVIE